MNDDVIQDLKQFITSTVSQQTADLHEDFDKLDNRLTTRMDGLEAKFDKLEVKIDDVDAKVDTILEAVGDRLDNHEVRIQKLETAHNPA